MTEVYEFEEEATIEATFQIGVTAEDHGALYNRDAPNQHPISAITNLQSTLDGISGDVSAETTRAEGVEGSLENLTTDTKTNLVSAINEVDSHADTNATNLSNHIANKNNPHEVTKTQVGLGNVDNTSDLDKPISTATQNALNLKVNTADLGNAELDIQKNGTSVGKFTANASTDKVINLVIPTQASDVSALPDSTKYGASLSLTINSSTFVVTAQLKDQDGNNLGSAQTIDLPLESVVVNGSYDSTNKKIILTLENGNTIDIPVGDLVAGLQSEITVDNKLASDLVDDTNQTHKFATSAQLSQIATNTGDISNLQSGKQDTIDSSHKLSADLVDDASTTNKFVTSSEKTTWNAKQDALTTAQLDAVNSGITSAKVTQYDGYATSKANVGLDNLNATGQMVIDSQNGTISNCILEIPQNIKLTLENNVLTLKSGSVLVKTGSTYSTLTITEDKTHDYSSQADGKYVVFAGRSSGNLSYTQNITKIGSGNTLPADDTDYKWFYLTTDNLVYYYSSQNVWADRGLTYPICIIDISSGVASFAKDSNGNDMIFNGACFVGSNVVVYPFIKCLIPNGYNSDGTLDNILYTTSSLSVTYNSLSVPERNTIWIQSDGTLARVASTAYIFKDNQWYSGTSPRYVCKLSDLTGNIDGMTIRQPYEGARDLLTDDKQDDVTTLTGYDATKTQTLKNVNGTLTWVDD